MLTNSWKIFSFVVLVAGFALCAEQQAHAYADPGSGLLLFQVSCSAVTGVFYLLSKRIRNIFKRRDLKDSPSEGAGLSAVRHPDKAA
jgi:hypothetical protein